VNPSPIVTNDASYPSWSPSENRSSYYYNYYPLPENTDISFNYNANDVNFGPGRPLLANFTYNETITVPSISANGTTTFLNETRTRIMNYTNYEGNGWVSVRDSYEEKYWREFDMQRTLDNRCSSGPWRTQSPIDLCPTAVNSKCFEHHQIRNRGGDYNLDDAEVALKILPSKLRIEYSRVNASLNETLLRPPHADFAFNWNGYISTVHIDIKIPSEHTVCGKRFAGEYQIYFYHPGRKQPIVISVLMEIHPNERPHLHFQKVLNEWQVLFDERKMICLDKIRKEKEAEDIFQRRMEYFLKTGMDSHEVSSSSSSSLSNEENDVTASYLNKVTDFEEHSSILDEPQENRKRFQQRLKNLRERASHPVFEEQAYNQETVDPLQTAFDGLSSSQTTRPPHHLRKTAVVGSDTPTISSTVLPTTSSTTTTTTITNTECVDSTDTFLFQGMSVTCAKIDTDCNNTNENSIVRSMCPVTCGICQENNHTTISFAPSPSPIPSRTNAPTRPRWNPFQPRILNSIYFYGYGGSLTEPPCSEWVAWRVLDVPMQISTSQWNQMRDILFHQVDGDCRRTSVNWNGSVARPTQSLNDRPLWQCTKDDYISDIERQQQRVSE